MMKKGFLDFKTAGHEDLRNVQSFFENHGFCATEIMGIKKRNIQNVPFPKSVIEFRSVKSNHYRQSCNSRHWALG